MSPESMQFAVQKVKDSNNKNVLNNRERKHVWIPRFVS